MLSKRLEEFVNYHNTGDGECNGIVLKSWADKHGLSRAERITLCYFFSITYCVESSIVLFQAREAIYNNPEAWAEANKDKIIFQSDRKYIRMKNSFQRCLDFWADNMAEIQKISSVAEIDLTSWIEKVEKWPLFGRFSAYLYLETVAWLLDVPVINAEMEWENGATATSGLMHIFEYDEAAEDYDKTRKLKKPFTHEYMEKLVKIVLSAITATGGDDNITKVETSLCAYRKFFKGTRYNGYYLDRMLEEIITMKKDFPEISKELIMIRCKAFPAEYLGEIGGWTGIRKGLKKAYQRTGAIT